MWRRSLASVRLCVKGNVIPWLASERPEGFSHFRYFVRVYCGVGSSTDIGMAWAVGFDDCTMEF